MTKFNKGDRVEYVKPQGDSHFDRQYPPVGSLATVINDYDHSYSAVDIRFDNGQEFVGALSGRFRLVSRDNSVRKTIEDTVDFAMKSHSIAFLRNNLIDDLAENLNKNHNIK